jgi:hypothetical protein
MVLAVVLYRMWSGADTSTGPASASNPRAAAGRAGGRDGGETPATAPDVHLRALDDERPKPESGDRNLFRFGRRPAPEAAEAATPPPSVVKPGPSVPSGPAPPPPIPLRFIGIVESPSQSKRLAALVDPTGRAYQGGEGDIVAGQYRVLNIGVESIELSYLDGRGRQTIRLSGS